MKYLKKNDPELYSAMHKELKHQTENLELIVSENFVSRAVLKAAGSVLTNKYAESYSYRFNKNIGELKYELCGRYYGGCEWIDEATIFCSQRVNSKFTLIGRKYV